MSLVRHFPSRCIKDKSSKSLSQETFMMELASIFLHLPFDYGHTSMHLQTRESLRHQSSEHGCPCQALQSSIISTECLKCKKCCSSDSFTIVIASNIRIESIRTFSLDNADKCMQNCLLSHVNRLLKECPAQISSSSLCPCRHL